ncbi:MAG: ribbon-helix-helix protein, CopG family [Caldilinea sp. CFX5]|nr:ribbon-helix-helix protein, CopG family [Caldilinea sp. CFX5]
MVQITIELPDDLYARLVVEAERQGITVEQLIVDILTQYLATLDEQEAAAAAAAEAENNQ